MFVGLLYPIWLETSSCFLISGKTMEASDKSAELGRGAEEIAAWLADDLADVDTVKSWLDRFSAIQSKSEQEGYQGTGNAHSLGVNEGLVYLECVYVEEMKVALTVDQMIAVLNNYMAFLKWKISNLVLPPQSFLVEFELEGNAAWKRYSESGGSIGWTKDEMKKNNAKLKRENSRSKLLARAGAPEKIKSRNKV